MTLTAGQRLGLMKLEAYLDYGLSVCGMAFVGIFMAAVGMGVNNLFLTSTIGVLVMLVPQNLTAKISDKIDNRLAFILLSKIGYGAGMIIMAVFRSFPSVLLYTVLANVVSGEMFSITIVYELIDAKEHGKEMGSPSAVKKTKTPPMNKSKEFAKYRLFGSIGWAFTAPFAGWAITTLNAFPGIANGLGGYSIMFTVSGMGIMLLSIFIYVVLRGYEKLPTARKEKKKDSHDECLEGANLQRKRGFYQNHAYVMIVVTTTILALSTAFQGSVFPAFIKQGLGGDEFFYGFVIFTWATAEVPLFFISSLVTRKYGWRPLLLLSFVFQAIKMGAYALLTPALLFVVIPLQVLNPFGISYPAKSYAITNEIAPENKAAGVTLNQTLNSVGAFAGGIIGLAFGSLMGDVADTLKGHHAFFFMAGAFAIAAALAFIVMWIVEKCKTAPRKGRAGLERQGPL